MLGIDLFQRYNLITDWHRIRADGVGAVFAKTTNGTRIASPPADAYVAGARGVGCLVGGYHYALAGDPGPQAALFAAELHRLDALGLAPALDFEDPSLPVRTTERRGWIIGFFTRLATELPSLHTALLYSSGTELSEIAADTIALPGVTVLVWDAEYGPNDGQPHPVVHYTGRVAAHQYTSTGHMPGATGDVDLDDITGNITHPYQHPVEDPVAFACYPPADNGQITFGVPQVGVHCATARLTLTTGWGDTGTCTVWAIAGVKNYLQVWRNFGIGQDNPWIAELPAGTTQISIAYASPHPLGVGLDVDK